MAGYIYIYIFICYNKKIVSLIMLQQQEYSTFLKKVWNGTNDVPVVNVGLLSYQII